MREKLVPHTVAILILYSWLPGFNLKSSTVETQCFAMSTAASGMVSSCGIVVLYVKVHFGFFHWLTPKGSTAIGVN